MSLVIPVIIFGGYCMYKLNLSKKYKKYREVNKLVSSKEKNFIMVHFISVKMILQVVYINFLQYMNNTVIKVGKNTYEISYVIEGKLYKMIVKPMKGPTPILQINDGVNDITDLVLPYLGPNYNWHHTKFSPEFFDRKCLTFEFSNGIERTFSIEEHLHIE